MRYSIPSLALSAGLLLQGCAGMGEHSIMIESEPAGAQVLASGAEIGTTPTRINPEQVFPPRFVNFTYRADGTLGIEHPGCEPYSTRVDDNLLSKDIRVELECDPSALAAAAAAPAAPPTAAQPAAPVAGTADRIQQRLEQLEILRERGAISADEYAAQRRRILEDL